MATCGGVDQRIGPSALCEVETQLVLHEDVVLIQPDRPGGTPPPGR
jgi:hypothetical protein